MNLCCWSMPDAYICRLLGGSSLRRSTMTQQGFALLLFLAVACSSTPTVAPSTPGLGSAASARSIVLHDLVNIVDVRDSASASFLSASDGQSVPAQGEVRTGSASAVRLDFSDGGTVHLAANTSVVFNSLDGPASQPLTQLTFEVGQLWVSLTHGQF